MVQSHQQIPHLNRVKSTIPSHSQRPGAQGPAAQHLPLHLPGTRPQFLRRGRIDLAARQKLLHVVHGDGDDGTDTGPKRDGF